MNTKCLIVDKMHSSIIPLLQEAGFDVDYEPDIKREAIKKIIHLYDGLIIRSKTLVNKNLLSNASKIKFVGRAGSGIDNLDKEYLDSKSIRIINAPEGNRDAVGEHTIGLILDLLHNITKGNAEIQANIWDREGNRGDELGAKTVGIIGYGNMGSSLAKKLKSFGCKVLAYDKYHSSFTNVFAQSVSLEQLMQETEILSLHLPLTPETLGMTQGDFFDKFKNNLIFINTSRGEISPLKSIVDAIKKGKIIKAGLDVLENEKLDNLTLEQSNYLTYLRQSQQVIFSPHVAGWSTESYKGINKVLVKKIISAF